MAHLKEWLFLSPCCCWSCCCCSCCCWWRKGIIVDCCVCTLPPTGITFGGVGLCVTTIRTSWTLVDVCGPFMMFIGFLKSFGIEITLLFLLISSVTRCWNKKLSKVSISCPKRSHSGFYLKSNAFYSSLESCQIFAVLLQQNNFQKSPNLVTLFIRKDFDAYKLYGGSWIANGM